MGQVRRLLLLLCTAPFLVGCTSLLARQGDPDLDVLYRGASRVVVEKEMGHPKEIIPLEAGRYIAVYRIKLGAPRETDGNGESLQNVGKGTAAAVYSGAFSAALNSAIATGWSSSTRSNGATALAVGLAVWGVSEFAGTVRELGRLSKARKHRLEVVFDDRNRMLTHQITPLATGGGSSDRARKLLVAAGTVATLVLMVTFWTGTIFARPFGMQIPFNPLGDETLDSRVFWGEYGFSITNVTTCIILLAAVRSSTWFVARFLAWRPWVALGERSYTIYILHVPLAVIMANALEGRIPGGTILLLYIFLLVAGTELIHQLVEKRFIAMKSRFDHVGASTKAAASTDPGR